MFDNGLFSHRPLLPGSSPGRRGKETFSGFFCQNTIPFIRAPLLGPNYLPKGPSPSTITLGAGIQQMDFRRTQTSICSILQSAFIRALNGCCIANRLHQDLCCFLLAITPCVYASLLLCKSNLKGKDGGRGGFRDPKFTHTELMLSLKLLPRLSSPL